MVAVTVLGLAGSGAIAQGVSFGGSAGMGVKYEGATEGVDEMGGMTETDSMIKWISDFDISISASGTTDGGLTFGASTAIEAGHAESVITDSEVYIGGESWAVKIGTLDPASHMGRSLGDVGYDGLGVDDVAEKAGGYGGTKADVEVSFSLGTASLAITAGQTSMDKKEEVTPAVKYAAATYEQVEQKTTTIFAIDTESVNTDTDTQTKVTTYNNPITAIGTIIEKGEEKRGTFKFPTTQDDPDTTLNEEKVDDYYLHTVTASEIAAESGSIFEDSSDYSAGDIAIIRVVGEQDKVTGIANTGDDVEDSKDELVAKSDLRLTNADMIVYSEDTVEVNGKMLTEEVMAKDAVMKTVTSQDTVWAAGVSFDIGSTTLGIGMDSEKLMQASVSADLGSFSGKLFYSRRKMDDDMKSTGTGVEIGVSAGENTSINAVYAQGKTDMDDTSTTVKGFGVGVSHSLGGGASLAAGFAKVEDQTKASVGVSMSF